ncbi:MAG TPA: hypothetical protein VNK91_02030 [Burkholderiaceae bacterium]|nr:hypothetical protein [Burkholderiaceae bacterium]
MMTFVVLATVAASSVAAEADYTKMWCAAQNGRVEVMLEDRTRADCITATHAVEVDFAPKWAEAIGQALHYARLTGKRAGILLIVGADEAHLLARLRATIAGACLPIDVWTVPR